MTQFSNIEEAANRLSQIIEQDIDTLEQDLTEKDGALIGAFYTNLVNSAINTAMKNVPKWAFNVLPWESMEYLGDHIRKVVLENAGLELTEKSWLQMSQAIDLLLEGKWSTLDYLSLIREIADTRNRLLTILLMQNL